MCISKCQTFRNMKRTSIKKLHKYEKNFRQEFFFSSTIKGEKSVLRFPKLGSVGCGSSNSSNNHHMPQSGFGMCSPIHIITLTMPLPLIGSITLTCLISSSSCHCFSTYNWFLGFLLSLFHTFQHKISWQPKYRSPWGQCLND